MKLQFNLLPDVKQEYLKAQRTKRTVIAISFIASAVSLFILLLMITTVYVINKKQLSDANKQIDSYSDKLKGIDNLDKILTVQNQLKSVSSLHQSKHITSRLYTYLPQLTPTTVCLGKVTLDLQANTLTIDGSADSLKSVNVFIDTLKFTKYAVDGKDSGRNAFTSVLETQFGLSSANAGGSSSNCGGKPALANYTLNIQFDQALFSNGQSVALEVPKGKSTTRSVIDDPSNDLFNGQTSTNSNQDSQGGQQ